MIKYEEGNLETNEYGAYFPDRPYYPFLAANGTDGILIGLSGFPDDPNWMCYSMQLPFRINLGWYKTARKDYEYAHKHYGPSTYGTSVALAGLTTMLTIGKDNNLGIREPKQFFDPKKRVLTTTYSLQEARGKIPAEIKVTTFMTDEHLLVERYEVLREPSSGIRFGFNLDTPHSTDLHELCVHPEKIEHKKSQHGFAYSYKYKSNEIPDGLAASWTDSPDAEYDNATTEYSPVITEGEAITHYVSVIDEYDSEDYRAEIKRLQEKTLSQGYDSILAEHIAANKPDLAFSSVDLPEEDLQYLYDYSHYALNATFEKESGFMPMGILPCNWHNAMFWDCWFASMAWLGSNRFEYSKAISSFYQDKLDEAKSVAAKLECAGARYAWTTNLDHFELNPESVIQFHNNAVVAVQSLQIYDFTGDKEFLSGIFEMVEQSLIFLTDRIVEIVNNQVVLKECAGLDESTHDLKGTDTWTAAIFAKGLERYLNACEILEKFPFQKNLGDVASMVKDAIDRNIDDDGVLQSFDGGMEPHWGSLIFNLFPNHSALEKTLDAISIFDESLDSYRSNGVAVYKGRIFTWTEYWISAILAMKGDPAGWSRLKKCAKFTDGFGSIPERVFYDGELLKRPFMTSHASYVWAINSLLLRRDGDLLAILANLPAGWKNVSFENITTPDGLKVSATMKNGVVTECVIVNINMTPAKIHLTIPGRKMVKLHLNHKERYNLGK